MTAKLTYQIIQSLSDSERDLLFDMLENDKRPLSFEELLIPKPLLIPSDKEIISYLIANCFSKIKDS